MSDLITRKPTAIMLELLRKGAASPRGIMTLADHNDRTQDGILRRDMAEVVHEDGATHSWLVINKRGRDFLAELDRPETGPADVADVTAEEIADGVEDARHAAPVSDVAGPLDKGESRALYAAAAERKSASAVSDRFAASQGAQERPAAPVKGSGPFAGAVAAQNAGERSVVLARLDAVWSRGYVTGPPMTHGEKRVAAEIIADDYTKGDTVTVHGRDRAALVEEYVIKSTYDVMNAYGSVRMRTGGNVWGKVADGLGGGSADVFRRIVQSKLDEGASAYRRTVLGADGRMGACDTMAPGAVLEYLTHELSAGGMVHRHSSGALRLTRSSGARLLLRMV